MLKWATGVLAAAAFGERRTRLGESATVLTLTAVLMAATVALPILFVVALVAP
jgi:hypothetical protein